MIRSTCCWFLLPLATALLPAVCAAERALVLERSHPTRMKWAEVEVRETAHVRTRLDGQEIDMPFGLSLRLDVRTRSEELDPRRETPAKVDARSARIGRALLAGAFEDGAEGFRRFRETLLAQVTSINPEDFARFLRKLQDLVGKPELFPTGSHQFVACVEIEGEASRPWQAGLERKDGKTDAWLRTYFHEPPSLCRDLASALGSAAPEPLVATSFRVEEQWEEVVRLAEVLRADAPPGPMPPQARFERRAAPKRPSLVSTSSSREEVVHHEWIGALEGALDPANPSWLIADVAPAELDVERLRRRAVVEEWSVLARERALGAGSRVMREDEWSVLVGHFATPGTENLTTRLQKYRAALVRDLDVASGLIASSHLEKALLQARWRLGLEEFWSLLCLPDVSGRGFRAQYCVGPMPACAPVLNADEACKELRRQTGS